jgi:hypothetical protein
MSPFMPSPACEEDAEVDDLMDRMKETTSNSGIREICKADPLIREFGRSLVGRLGTNIEQDGKDNDNIRSKLRHVGRLLKCLNESEAEPKELSFYLSGTHFKKVV